MNFTEYKSEYMKMSFVIIAMLLFLSMAHAQIGNTIYLWPDKVPGEKEAKHAPLRTDNTKGDVIRLTDITNPVLEVFEPEQQNNSGIGIIICPGGGYNILAIDKEGYEIAEWLNKLGYTAFVLQYRVPNKQKGSLIDTQRAIRIVRDKSKKYNIDSGKIVLMGFSAGGSLCARASTRYNEELYSKVDDIDNLSCRPDYSMLIYPAYLDKGKNRSITPEITINDKTPPFFIFGTSDDDYGNSSLVLATALRDNKIPVELHLLQEGGHGYGLRSGNIAAETWPSLAKKWLNLIDKPKDRRTQNFPKLTINKNPISKKENLWVFIMAGQSNMAGRGFVEPMDTIPSNRILTIDKNNQIVLAKEPVHFYEPSMSGLDCGLSFGKELIKQLPDSISILLIPTAVGGSSISKWLGDSLHRDVQLLTNFKQKVDLGKNMGKLKGILWLQGESDANNIDIPEYQYRLSQLCFKFREIVGNKKLPILIGEIGSYSNHKENWDKINKQIKNYTLSDISTLLIETSDLKDIGDKLHFNSEGQRVLGRRFANEYFNKYK